jgi:ParB-like chromosome segregation protein Spo0J
VADIIAYLVDGNSITPPAVAEYHAKLVIVGGHHRLAVCRAKNMETVPVLVEENDAGALAQILKALRWQDAIQ